MVKHFLILNCLFLLSLFCLGQGINTKQNDSNLILQQIKKAVALTESSPNEAYELLEINLDKSKRTKFYQGEFLATAALTRWNFGNDLNKAITLGNEAIKGFAKYKIVAGEKLTDLHLLLAEAYDEQGKKDSSAYFYYLLGDEMLKENSQDPNVNVQILTKLAIFWMNLDYNAETGTAYKKTVDRFLAKARLEAKKMSDTILAKSSIYFLEGAYNHGLQKMDSARYFYLKFLKLRESNNSLNITRKISTLYNIADTYVQERNPTLALYYTNQIKEIGNEEKNKRYLAYFTSLVDLLTAKALFQQNKFQESINLLDTTFIALNKTGKHYRAEVVESFNIYAENYEALGNDQKALAYKKEYLTLHDSLSRIEKLDMISRLEIKNGLADKDSEIERQQLNLEKAKLNVKQKNLVIGLILAVAFLGILIFSFWRARNRSKQKLQNERIENLQQKIKIERLKASISGEEKERVRIGRELHDGIGGLLSVSRMNFEMARKQLEIKQNPDFTDGIQLLEEATVELRKAAYNLMPEVLMEHGLSSAVKAYCEKMMVKGKTKLTFQSLGNTYDKSATIDLPIYRIIQELVHNIFKHSEAHNALVQLNYQEDGTLSITVEDDGIGIPKEALVQNISMGLKNIRDRVNDLGGKVDIQSSKENGTSVYLEFDFYNDHNKLL